MTPTAHLVPAAGGRPARPRVSQRMLVAASGLLVLFFAFGFGGWFSGLVSWISYYCGARGANLERVAQVSASVGFAGAALAAVCWYRRRSRRGMREIPAAAALVACLTLPLGSISWAIFVDAIAWHYQQDIVRPAFDVAIMYLVLGAALPAALGVPRIVTRLNRRLPHEM